MKPRVRITALSSDEGPHFPLLEAAGFEVLPGNRSRNLWKEDELIAELEGCCAIVAGSGGTTRHRWRPCANGWRVDRILAPYFIPNQQLKATVIRSSRP